jgi:DNA-binding CsgD family transcriptional regulator
LGASRSLRLGDVRAVFRLIGECRDLGRDPIAWRRHSFEGLGRLLGARAAVGGEHRRPDPRGLFEFIQPIEVGLTPTHLAIYGEFLRAGGPNHPAILPSMDRLTARPQTLVRKQLIDEPAFHRSGTAELFRMAELGDVVQSIVKFGVSGSVNVISLHRSHGERAFSARERRLIHLFHDEAGPLIGPTLSAAWNPVLGRLTPRVRQTLECLLEGDSEKQVAARLGLSRPTVHQYVTALYRHFGVSSRAELLARFIRNRP